MTEQGFEADCALGIIQSNDQWLCNQIGFALPPDNMQMTAPPYDRSLLDSHYTATATDLSEFMDQLIRPNPSSLSQNTDDFSIDNTPSNNNYVAQSDVHAPPQKAPRRDCYERSGDEGGERPHHDHEMRMITLLMECAVQISTENLGEAQNMLLELTQMASPHAASCAERVVAYFAEAMASRIVNSCIGVCSPLLLPYKTILSAFQAFNNLSPFIKFGHFTANQTILEAFHQEERIHIIDLDIMQGLQWPALFHILATRPNGPPQVRMTGLGPSGPVLEETGMQLAGFARRLGMRFEFHPIARRSGDLDPSSVIIPPGRRSGEAVAVHLMRHALYDATGDESNTMRLLEHLGPRVVTLVEQEMGHNGGPFLGRFVGALHYFSTVFDSLGSSWAVDDVGRHRVESGLLAREIANVVAVGGPGRGGEEKVGRWRDELARRGFVQVEMSGNAMAQAQLIVNMFPPALGYSVLHGSDGSLGLGWKGAGLYTASAWTARSSL
ncbi:Protein SCARECROW 1 [Ananas comosus]|uniref:Protein SCARECROW 1 n=1 Tax=Ananas comosus TaxID=4615 RepID=A0A199URW3_ANACO|nr:Protein SCARECROW 1 [Ananas comosus]